MEQRWKNDKSKPLWEKKTEGGLRLRQNKERIKPGQRIRATREELGRHIGEFELIETPKSEQRKSQLKESTQSARSDFSDMSEKDEDSKKKSKKSQKTKKEDESTLGSSTDLEE